MHFPFSFYLLFCSVMAACIRLGITLCEGAAREAEEMFLVIKNSHKGTKDEFFLNS